MCRGQLQCCALTLVRLLTVKLCLDFVVYLQRAAGHLLSPSRNKKHNCFAVVEAGLWRSGNTSSFGCTVRIWISIPVSNFRRNIFGRAHTGPTSPSCSIYHIALGKFSGGWIPSWSWRAWSLLKAIEFRQIQKDGGITNGFALFWLSDLIIKQVSVGFCCFALHSEGLGRGCWRGR